MKVNQDAAMHARRIMERLSGPEAPARKRREPPPFVPPGERVRVEVARAENESATPLDFDPRWPGVLVLDFERYGEPADQARRTMEIGPAAVQRRDAIGVLCMHGLKIGLCGNAGCNT